jgi:CRISPR-associated protein Cst2
VRRAVLEVTRAVSLTPWGGDVTFNAASPGATPSAEKKGAGNPVPYGTEMHATRYQYGFAMTPAKIRVKPDHRAKLAIESLVSLGEVAGNHGRFLFDFSAESIVLRLTHEAAPRILYGFDADDGGAISIAALADKVKAGDVPGAELYVGGPIVKALSPEQKEALKAASLHDGVRAAAAAAIKRMTELLADGARK